MKDIVIVDYITKISQTQVSPKMMEDFNITIKNVRKWRNKIERRKLKINNIYRI
jgi:hypothetical protein